MPDRFRAVLGMLLLSTRALADLLGCDDRLVRRWASGRVPVPPEVGAWLEQLAAVWTARPAPQPGWYGRPVRSAVA